MNIKRDLIRTDKQSGTPDDDSALISLLVLVLLVARAVNIL
ncbi:MAG: hypothetical protein ABJC10_13060 [Acidobacteriota bacterium]